MWAPTAAAGVRPAHVPWRRNISGHVVQRTESLVFLRQHCKLWRSKLRMQMKRNYAGYLDLSPFILWGDLATKTVEMMPVSYTHLRAHETDSYLVCRLLLEKK